MKEEPYLLRLCVSAFSTDPGGWSNNIRHVQQLSRELLLPQSAVGMWHDILSVCLNKNESHQELSTATLSESLIRGINHTLSDTIIESNKQLQQFILKTSCVLLRMGFLNNDPKLSRLGFVSGCIRSNAFEPTIFGETQVQDFVSRIKDALTPDGHFSDVTLLQHVLQITSFTPVAKLETIVPIVRAILQTIMDIYDHLYYEFALEKSGKLPIEFLILFTDIKKFEKSLFFEQTKRLFDYKTINVSILHNVVLKQSTSKDASFSTGYLKYIHHAQTLLSFYKQHSGSKNTNLLEKMVTIVSIFEKRAPKKMNLLSGVSINIGESIIKESTSGSSNDLAKMALASKIFRGKH
jgi:hypothetical protein